MAGIGPKIGLDAHPPVHPHPPRRPHLLRHLRRSRLHRPLTPASRRQHPTPQRPRHRPCRQSTSITPSEAAESDTPTKSFVEALCTRLAIPLTTQTVEHRRPLPPLNRQTIEEAARNLRYDHFRNLIASGQASAVLTAHTLDDQAETVLMKLLRGAWTEGIAAISPILEVPNGQILRPLLAIPRATLRTYLEAQNQPWREDSSNADESFTRNRIRHTVLPILRQENPSIDRTLANLAEIAREEESRWTSELSKVLPHLILPGKPVRGGGRSNSTAPGEASLAIELDRLKPLDPALRRRVLRAAARQLGCRLSFDETNRLLTFTGLGQPHPTVPTKPGSKLQLSAGLLAERSARELRLMRQPTHS